VSAFGNLVVVDEVGIRPFCPGSWGLIELVRKNAQGYRDGDIFRIEK
jgi:hypothetical protein